MEKMDDGLAEELLSRYHIPVLQQEIVRDLKSALRAGGSIGYPVALKVSSPDIVHKTEVDGVALNIKDKQGLEAEFKRMEKSFRKAKVKGYIVQKMIAGRNVREVIIGSKIDAQFGPVVMFGLGGVFVEVLEDVSFRLAPITMKDAREMIAEIKGRKLLGQFRGKEPVNMQAIATCLVNVSRLVSENPKIKELDINPLFADDKRVLAADFRVLVD